MNERVGAQPYEEPGRISSAVLAVLVHVLLGLLLEAVELVAGPPVVDVAAPNETETPAH